MGQCGLDLDVVDDNAICASDELSTTLGGLLARTTYSCYCYKLSACLRYSRLSFIHYLLTQSAGRPVPPLQTSEASDLCTVTPHKKPSVEVSL